MKIYSINTIIMKNIFKYQYSEFDALLDAIKIAHANDMLELVNISKKLYECQITESNNINIINKAIKIFDQYGYPIEMWSTFI